MDSRRHNLAFVPVEKSESCSSYVHRKLFPCLSKINRLLLLNSTRYFFHREHKTPALVFSPLSPQTHLSLPCVSCVMQVNVWPYGRQRGLQHGKKKKKRPVVNVLHRPLSQIYIFAFRSINLRGCVVVNLRCTLAFFSTAEKRKWKIG